MYQEARKFRENVYVFVTCKDFTILNFILFHLYISFSLALQGLLGLRKLKLLFFSTRYLRVYLLSNIYYIPRTTGSYRTNKTLKKVHLVIRNSPLGKQTKRKEKNEITSWPSRPKCLTKFGATVWAGSNISNTGFRKVVRYSFYNGTFPRLTLIIIIYKLYGEKTTTTIKPINIRIHKAYIHLLYPTHLIFKHIYYLSYISYTSYSFLWIKSYSFLYSTLIFPTDSHTI